MFPLASLFAQAFTPSNVMGNFSTVTCISFRSAKSMAFSLYKNIINQFLSFLRYDHLLKKMVADKTSNNSMSKDNRWCVWHCNVALIDTEDYDSRAMA